MLHIGTLLAVLIYFFRDWVQIIGQGFGMRVGRRPGAEAQPHAAVAAGDRDRSRWASPGLLFNKQAEGAWRNPW